MNTETHGPVHVSFTRSNSWFFPHKWFLRFTLWKPDQEQLSFSKDDTGMQTGAPTLWLAGDLLHLHLQSHEVCHKWEIINGSFTLFTQVWFSLHNSQSILTPGTRFSNREYDPHKALTGVVSLTGELQTLSCFLNTEAVVHSSLTTSLKYPTKSKVTNYERIFSCRRFTTGRVQLGHAHES